MLSGLAKIETLSSSAVFDGKSPRGFSGWLVLLGTVLGGGSDLADTGVLDLESKLES